MPVSALVFLQQLVKSDRQLADTPTGRVEDCIGDSRANTGNADFAYAVRAHRRVWIGDVGPDHVNLRNEPACGSQRGASIHHRDSGRVRGGVHTGRMYECRTLVRALPHTAGGRMCSAVRQP